MADVEVVEGHPDIPEESKKKLTPGAQARVYRDGDVLECAILIPQRGPLEIRHLAVGSYVVKDETGGYEEFKVLPKVETVAIPTRYSERQDTDDEELIGPDFVGSGEPGSSSMTPPEKLRPGQTNSGSSSVENGPPKLGADVDVPVLAEPGSALIEELPDPDDTPDGNLERLKPTKAEESRVKEDLKSTGKRKVSKKKQDEPTAEEIQASDEEPAAKTPEKDEKQSVGDKVKAEAQELKDKAAAHAKTTEKGKK